MFLLYFQYLACISWCWLECYRWRRSSGQLGNKIDGHKFFRVNMYKYNSMICSDIWEKYHEWYFKIVIQNFTRVKFETILKYHNWYLYQISRTNHAIICLYYYRQKVCNFHMQVFQIKVKYHCSKPIKLQKFLI